ncbi:MAG: methyl-accepting chemotaxis protein [Candidatus Competibacteraceae bacterium]
MIGFLVIGIASWWMLRNLASAVDVQDANVQENTAIGEVADLIDVGIVSVVTKLSLGNTAWDEGMRNIVDIKARFDTQWRAYLQLLSPLEKQQAMTRFASPLENIQETFKELEPLIESRDRARIGLFMANDLDELINPFLKALAERQEKLQNESKQIVQDARQYGLLFMTLGIALVAVVGLLILFLGLRIARSIAEPVKKISDTVQQVSEGNFVARTELSGTDELSELGGAFDRLLDERVATLVTAERENEQLNNSVIGLLQAVSRLSQRDLTIKVPVTEDITGPVADALNLLTSETAGVLAGVTKISEHVAIASDQVKTQSDTVINVAEAERQEVEQTVTELNQAAESMSRIAELAKACNTVADNAIKTTQTALETVTNTVSGINNTRDVIRETEKRIKRLGERSQEISGVVNLINTIAERTHILALNASMHAASAGEAGRGFAVVANEVQRLAENAREATSQIATLVSNIQTETADTVNTMNMAISQVVEGSRLAEQAGEQMKRTQQTTAELVASVQQIATRSQDQAHATSTLRERARQIQQSTEKTSHELQAQTVQTNNLVEYAKGLLDSVRVFKLPA